MLLQQEDGKLYLSQSSLLAIKMGSFDKRKGLSLLHLVTKTQKC